jgi:hypothetical protein
VGTSFSEITESIKHQPLYRLVGVVCWVWYCLCCTCLLISYITRCTGINHLQSNTRVLVLGAWAFSSFQSFKLLMAVRAKPKQVSIECLRSSS